MENHLAVGQNRRRGVTLPDKRLTDRALPEEAAAIDVVGAEGSLAIVDHDPSTIGDRGGAGGTVLVILFGVGDGHRPTPTLGTGSGIEPVQGELEVGEAGEKEVWASNDRRRRSWVCGSLPHNVGLLAEVDGRAGVGGDSLGVGSAELGPGKGVRGGRVRESVHPEQNPKDSVEYSHQHGAWRMELGGEASIQRS